MPIFSIIIPTYNRLPLLKKTLDSIWEQNFTDFEVIVVDDGSTDKTVDHLYNLNGRIELFRQDNRGPGAARNLGIVHARGEYVAFLDSDDLWFPWTLTCFAELIKRHNNPAILSAQPMEFVSEAELAVVRELPVKAEVFGDYFASHRISYIIGAGMSVLKREALLKTGGFTERHINGEDLDLIFRMGLERGFVQITEPITLGWRRHSVSATKDTRRTVEGNIYLVEQERRGAYPGGMSRVWERRAIITRRTRPMTLECARHGLWKDAWELYQATFKWNAALRRWKYLAGFPITQLLGAKCSKAMRTADPCST